MSRGFTVQERIGFPVQSVWTYISDLELCPTWMKGINSMTPAVKGVEDCVGARYQTNITTPGRGSNREVEILAWEPNHRFALSSKEGGISAVYEYILRSQGEEKTDVILNAQCTATGLWKLIHPLVARMMERHDSDQLLLLRRAMESATDSTEQFFELVNE